MIVLSIAHSKVDPGNTHCFLVEHEVSKVMTAACADALRAEGIVCAVLVESSERNHLPGKVAQVNAYNAELAVEIHTNGVLDAAPNYGEAIYAPHSADGFEAAVAVSVALKALAGDKWPIQAPHADDRGLYFLIHTACPALIVEPIFQSNPAQADFLRSPDGPESIGQAVASGIKNWLSAKKG